MKRLASLRYHAKLLRLPCQWCGGQVALRSDLRSDIKGDYRCLMCARTPAQAFEALALEVERKGAM